MLLSAAQRWQAELTLLLVVKRHLKEQWVHRQDQQQPVQLTGDVALQAAQNLFLTETLLGPALDVCLRWGIGSHADDGDHPQGTVGFAVAAPIQAMPMLTPR